MNGRHAWRFTWALIVAGLASAAPAAKEVYTDPADAELPVDFKIQGEYLGTIEGGGQLGAQVIALGNGALQAVLLPGGLPGAGWDGKNKILLQGSVEGGKAAFAPVEGQRQYLAGPADKFSATSQNPSPGQKAYTGASDGAKFVGKTEDGKPFSLAAVKRTGPTLGAKPPQGAIVLFDGANTDEWNGGRLDTGTKLLNTDGKDIRTKRKFTNYKMHVEFMLPYRPAARGQGRGNSGFYQVELYEMQILDSFGLDGKNNECGGIYTLAEPLVNMCLPPLVWQTYDVEFQSAVVDQAGKKLKPAILTAIHNGVVIHDKLELKGKTGGSRSDPEGTPGPILLQGHGNPLQFKNLWIVETK